MAKTSYINVRVEDHVKTRAEDVLNELGINISTAIDIYLKQIILQEGIPFDVRIPHYNYEEQIKQLAKAISFPNDNNYPIWLRKISLLYAKGEMDLDVAVYAAKKHLNNL